MLRAVMNPESVKWKKEFEDRRQERKPTAWKEFRNQIRSKNTDLIEPSSCDFESTARLDDFGGKLGRAWKLQWAALEN